ncbi:MAG: nickel pincer cofactor biosynthesis protein LarB [Spirochaetales bacterium]|nr:nickel pincer cofactor biosynthesis protein LarB [Spirochaetales bacterium]
MNGDRLIEILESYKKGEIDQESALDVLKDLPFKDLGYASLDNHRALRVGYPEVIYCSGKSDEQLRGIFSYFLTQESSILGTRASREQFDAVQDLSPELVYEPISRTITATRGERKKIGDSYIAVVTAGTSDIPVAEEAAVTAEFFGSRVERIYDVGVAGIHRLFSRIELIRGAKVIIVAAGMEGALASVVGGLVNSPVIAVPTSVGYGASFNGLSALLTMLNSCASGISVVNIDNGFGAAYQADMINRL